MDTAVAAPETERIGGMLAVLLSAMFLAQFDYFVVNVAAPSFTRQLHAGPTALELIVGGYAFAYATGMITGGRLGDRFGQHRIFTAGVVAFTATSLLCGLAQTPAELVVARLLQGLAGALMVPQVLALITAALPVSRRSAALGWYGVACGLGSIAGQILGGLLLDANLLGLGWRALFLVNAPVGIVAAPLAWRLLPRVPADRLARLDVAGALGVSTSLALVLVPLTIGSGPVWLCAAAAGPVAAATLRRQRRLAAAGSRPVLDLSLFGRSSFRAGLLANAAFMAYFASFMFTLTLLLQDGLGFSALHAGLVFAPMGVLFGAASLGGFQLVRRYGPRVVLCGTALIAAGLVLLAVRAEVAGGLALPWLLPALGLVGTGNGLVLPQLIGIALLRVRPEQAGIGSGLLNTAGQFAGSGGVAAIGALFFAVAGAHDDSAAMRTAALVEVILVLLVLGCVARAMASRSA